MPRLALIATGGTIAGTGPQQRYTAATLDAESLLDAVPALRHLAAWHVEQAFSLDSRDLTPAHWLQLATRVQAQLDDPTIDGVVITHGTDTLEETAFALYLLLPTGKPVVLTAAMRPATSLSADGPLNLWQAACVALYPAARHHGPLVVANDSVIEADKLVKQHTHSPAALQSRPGSSAAGAIFGTSIKLSPGASSSRPALLRMPEMDALPRVDILYAYAGATPDLLEACLASGAHGIVLALTGHGSIPANWRDAIAHALQQNIPVVRATRVAAGGVWPDCNEDDTRTGSIAAGLLSPQQARVLLLLALACHRTGDLRELFATI